MKFTLNRDKVLASTRGHTIEFIKGEPVEVPHDMVSEVMAIGAIPEEDLPEENTLPDAEPADPQARKALIVDAMEKMALRFGPGVPVPASAWASSSSTGLRLDFMSVRSRPSPSSTRRMKVVALLTSALPRALACSGKTRKVITVREAEAGFGAGVSSMATRVSHGPRDGRNRARHGLT